MTNTKSLIDKAIELCQPKTIYRLSKNTGISQARLSVCLNHEGTLDNEGCVRLAKFLDMDSLTVIAYAEADRAAKAKGKSAAKKQAFWEGQLPRVHATVATAIALFVAYGISQGHASQDLTAAFMALALPRYTLCEVLGVFLITAMYMAIFQEMFRNSKASKIFLSTIVMRSQDFKTRAGLGARLCRVLQP